MWFLFSHFYIVSDFSQNIFPRKNANDITTKTKEAGSSFSPSSNSTTTLSLQTTSTQPNCIVCGIKASRTNSIYCSDDCIRKYASTAKVSVSSTSTSSLSLSNVSPLETTTTTATPSPTTIHMAPRVNQLASDTPRKLNKMTTQSWFRDKLNRVICVEKSSGKYITGKNAPTTDNLNKWLEEHPSCEVLKPGTPLAEAFKAKQMQLKSLAKSMAEKELFAVSQPAKVQSTLRFNEGDKKMVYGLVKKSVVRTTIVSPTPTQTPTGGLKRPHAMMTTPSPTSISKSVSATKPIEPIAKTPKLTSTPAPRTTIVKKRPADEPKTPISTKSESSSGERDRIRENARKALVEQLLIRTNEIKDPNAAKLTETEIQAFIKAAEAEMFSMFGNDTNMKYKAKYRSLIFNIKDRKNLTLFEKISNKMIQPKQFVRLSPEELASQELAKWRENENKHQLEMITKSELDLLACGKSYVLKTHKGEEVIQESSERLSLDASISVQDVVSVLNNSTVSSSSEVGGDASTSNTPIIIKDNRYDKYLSADGEKLGSLKKDYDKSHDKKDRHDSRSSSSSSKHKRKRSRDRHGSSHSSHSHKDKNRERDSKRERTSSESRKEKKDHKTSSSNIGKHHISDKDKKLKKEASSSDKPPISSKAQKSDEKSIADKILKAQSTIDSILHPEEFKKTTENTIKTTGTQIESSSLKRQSSAANESDQEPTSTVTIPTPPECTPELQSTTPPPAEKSTTPIIWSGTINMVDVATFQVSLRVLSGNSTNIGFNTDLDVVGRIRPDIVWDYLEKIRITKDILLLRFSPQSDDDAVAYKTFVQYLDERRRLGVFQQTSKLVKDFYVLPLPAHTPLPTVLKRSFTGELEPNRGDLLIGIIVKNRLAVQAPARIVPRLQFATGHKTTVNDKELG